MENCNVVDNMEENVQFCILVGKDETVVNAPPLKTFHGPECMSLTSIVDQITPPGSKVVIHSGTKLVRLDRSESCRSVEYNLQAQSMSLFVEEFKNYEKVSVSRISGKESDKSPTKKEASQRKPSFTPSNEPEEISVRNTVTAADDSGITDEVWRSDVSENTQSPLPAQSPRSSPDIFETNGSCDSHQVVEESVSLLH